MDNEIKKFMAAKVAENISLSDIQKLVNETFKTHYTFMEIRVMASELDDVDWGRNDPPPAPETPAAPAAGDADGVLEPEAEAAPGASAGATTVEVSKIVRPGMMFSGTVRFGSGATADWYVDSTGRLGLDNVNGKPNEQDVVEFQDELRKVLR